MIRNKEQMRDEEIVLDKLRDIQAKGHGEMLVAVKSGRIVKLWTTDKLDLEQQGKLREGTQP